MLTGWVPPRECTAELLHKHVYGRFDPPSKRVVETARRTSSYATIGEGSRQSGRMPGTQRELEFIHKKCQRRGQPTPAPCRGRSYWPSKTVKLRVGGISSCHARGRMMREELGGNKRGGASASFQPPEDSGQPVSSGSGTDYLSFWPPAPPAIRKSCSARDRH